MSHPEVLVLARPVSRDMGYLLLVLGQIEEVISANWRLANLIRHIKC